MDFKAYRFVRKSFTDLLPHERTLGKWLGIVKASPGFTEPAFTYLKREIETEASAGKDLLFALSVDEMSIMRKAYRFILCLNH